MTIGRHRKLQGVTDRLNKAVLLSGKTPGQIQKEAGICKTSYYYHMSGGAMGELYIAKYCAVLNISADWLLGIRKGNPHG